MRRASTVSVSGAVLLALLCIALIYFLPDPAGAQQGGDPLEDLPADIRDTDADGTPNRIVILLPQGQECTVSADAEIDVNDAEGTPEEFENDDNNVRITFSDGRIIIDNPVGSNDLPVADDFDAVEGERNEGTVTDSTGIVCEDAAAPAPQPRQLDPPGPPNGCDASDEIRTVGTRRGDITVPFEIDGNTFGLSYVVDFADDTATLDQSVVIDVLTGNGKPVQDVETFEEDGSGRYKGSGGPASFQLRVRTDPDDAARYQVVIYDCDEAETPEDPPRPSPNDDLDCGDFDNRRQAQDELDSDPSDPNNLDADDDGRACEGFDYSDGGGNGEGDDLNCDDFDNQNAAQDVYNDDTSDPNNLDADDDGAACEDFPYGKVMGGPGEEELPETSGPPLLPLVAAVIALATLGAFSALRVQTSRRR